MKLEHHITLSTVVSGMLFMIFGSWGLSIASFVSGIFIDLDHIIDYFLENEPPFNMKNFFQFFYEEKHKKITLFLHGWEILILLCLLSVFFRWNVWLTGVTLGYGTHMASDFLYSRTSFASYSLLWRWKCGFDSNLIFPRERGYRPSGRHRKNP